MQLRPYQQECVDVCVSTLLKDTTPIVAELATGAGKSLIVSEIAKQIHTISGKSILCLAPSKELVLQNRAKYLLTGNPASIYSASVGSKCLRHPVVFGTPQTVVNAIDKFGDRFALIIIDEAHGITKSVKKIIDSFRLKYPKLRVLGLTATPYRLGSGYIYAEDVQGKGMHEDTAKDPYFTKLVYKIGANALIDMGYLTKPTIGELGGEHYDTLHIKPNAMGKFDAKEIDKAFLGHGRLTSQIVQDVVIKSKDRQGVMIFAATIAHAQEVMASLPDGISALVTGETDKKERARTVQRFINKDIKYLVNVAVFTTGFDATHVDVIALLRKTESAGLLQQIIGRGLRLHDGKKDCLILDYAQNLEEHSPDGDIFNPAIKAIRSGSGATMEQVCPLCKFTNTFSMRENKGDYKINEDGYFTDLLGVEITNDDGVPIPSHYGRRCQGRVNGGKGVEDWAQCDYRWSLKVCPNCDEENDITARRCTKCKGELVDPNAKLILEFKQHKRDPTNIQIDEVLNFTHRPTMSKAGNECIVVEFVTPYRTFKIWLQKKAKSKIAIADLAMFYQHINDIKTVEYIKDHTGFYRVLSYNKEVDKCQVNTQSKSQ